METYHRSRLPDDTYDVDGDGVVSMEDLYLASKFDVNGDGILQDDETVELRKQMVSTLLRSYEELPHAGNNIKVRGIIKKFRNDPTQEVQSRHFMKRCDPQDSLPSALPTHSRWGRMGRGLLLDCACTVLVQLHVSADQLQAAECSGQPDALPEFGGQGCASQLRTHTGCLHMARAVLPR